MARVPLIDLDDASPECREIFEQDVLPMYIDSGTYTGRPIPPWRAWANSPQYMKHLAQFTTYMTQGCGWSIDHVKVRELMVVAAYKQNRATAIALEMHQAFTYAWGYTREQLDLLNDLPAATKSPLFTHEERTLLTFVEELHSTGDTRIEIWQDIVELYDYQGAVEMVATFAFWQYLGTMCVPFHIEMDDPRVVGIFGPGSEVKP